MQLDRHLAISAGWCAGPALGIAMMAAPDYLKLTQATAGVVFWSGIAVFIGTLGIIAYLLIRDRVKKPAPPVSPMTIVCDFIPVVGLYDNIQNYVLRFGVKNNSHKTIESVRLILHSSWFSRAFFSDGGRSITSEIVVLHIDKIDPKTTEIKDVMNIEKVVPGDPNILSSIIEFTLEARALDTLPVTATIEYNPESEKRFQVV